MFRFCVKFLLGLSGLYWLQTEQQAFVLVVSSGAGLLLIPFFLKLNDSSALKKNYFLHLLPIIFGVFWGSGAAYHWMNSVPTLIPEPLVAEVDGYICSIPHSRDQKTISFDFCVKRWGKKTLSFFQNNKLRLNYYRVEAGLIAQLSAGSHWKLQVKLKPIHGRLNPGGFDYERWLLSAGFIATGYVKGSAELAREYSISAAYQNVRQSIYNNLVAVLPDPQYQGITLALAMGERSSISAEQWQSVKDSGTSHLLAISGLHIGIAALWSYYLCLWFARRIKILIRRVPAQKVAQIGSLVGATSIALLSGFGYPAQRALIMLMVYLFTQWSGRALSLSQALSASVVVIVIFQPFAILTVSFWLSILAVAIIVLLVSYKPVTNGRHVGVKGWLRINWYLFVGLLPITWVVFDSVSLVGFLANLILIPITSFLTTPVIYLGLLSLPFSNEISSSIYFVADILVGLTLKIQYFFSELNHFVTVSSLSPIVFLLLFSSIFILLLPKKFPGKPLIVPMLLVSLLLTFDTEVKNNFKLVVFDIGQGLAIHVQVGNKNLLFDTGYGNQQFSMAQGTLLPYFKRNGIQQLDILTISHADADHAGGLKSLSEDLSIGKLYAGEDIKLEYESCHEIKPWRWSVNETQVEFQFMEHLPKEHLTGNNASCVLMISVNEKQILLTGDIEKRAEKALMTKDVEGILSGVDLMVSPHHGSLTSSTKSFVSFSQPKVTIHSAGFANQWAFPRSEVLARYRAAGSVNYITHREGAITVTFDADGELNVATERSTRSHFWYG